MSRWQAGSSCSQFTVGGNEAGAQDLRTHDRLEAARGAERVSDRALDRVHRNARGGFAEDAGDRRHLHRVVVDRAGTVRADEVDVGGRDAAHRASAMRMARAAPAPSRAGAVMCVASPAKPGPHNLDVGPRAARPRMVSFLDDQHRRTFAEEKAGAPRIERPHGVGRRRAQAVEAVHDEVAQRLDAADDDRRLPDRCE